MGISTIIPHPINKTPFIETIQRPYTDLIETFFRYTTNVQGMCGDSAETPSNNEKHLFKLFRDKLSRIGLDLGVELFELEAPTVEAIKDALWLSEGMEAWMKNEKEGWQTGVAKA